MRKLDKVLVIAPSWIGDLVIAQALFKLIKMQNSHSIIDVLANEKLLPLLERMPEVDRSFVLPFAHGELRLIKRYRFACKLRIEKYDRAIILPNSFKSALIPFWAHVPQRIGWRGEMRYGLLSDMRILDKKKLPLMVERYLALGQEKNAPIKIAKKCEGYIHKKKIWPRLQTDKKRITRTLQRLKIKEQKTKLADNIRQFLSSILKRSRSNLGKPPILAICPGAEYGPAKRWPAENFAEVAKIKFQEGWQIWLLGGQGDQNIARAIQETSGNICLDLTGKTDLGEAVDLLSLAKVVITNDSGLMHAAAALGKPLVAIYGSSSPKYTPPLCEKAEILSLNLSCSPCFKRRCPKRHMRCLLDLVPQMVIEAMENLI